jgi:hypothetical protein
MSINLNGIYQQWAQQYASQPASPSLSLPEPEPMKGPVLAWRAWRLVGDTLQSMTRAVDWEGPTLSAHQEPTADGESGIYAKRDRASVERYYAKELAEADVIVGTVELSGRIVEHEDGYRAERATIQSLYGIVCEYEALTKFGWMREQRGISEYVKTALERRYACAVDVTLADRALGDEPLPTVNGRVGVYVNAGASVSISGCYFQ